MHCRIAKIARWGRAVIVLAFVPLTIDAGTDVQINSDAPGDVQNEIRLAIDPSNSQTIVTAYNDKNGSAIPNPLGISFSSDGGLNWTDTQLSVPPNPFAPPAQLDHIFDPFIATDSLGNFYAGYIATTQFFPDSSGIFIERSTDGGATWSGPTTIDTNGPGLGPVDPSYRFNDRPDMTVDSSDNLHVVWIKDVGVGLPTSDIYFAKSGPPPLDFTGLGPSSIAPQTVNDFPNGTDEANAPDVAIAPDGTVYVAWIDVDVTNPNPKSGQLMIDSSFNGGATFGVDIVAQNILALPTHLATASGAGTMDDARAGSYPVIAVDPSNSLTVYMAYVAAPAGPGGPTGADEADVFFIKSTDGGNSWTNPLRVNDDNTTTDQFHPAMAVKPDGTIDIIWYDKRNSTNDDQWDVYFTKSTDGGASFLINTRITDQSFATPSNSTGTEPWLGEYLGLVLDSTNAYIAFTSSLTDSKGDVFFDSIANSPTIPDNCDIKPGSDPNSIRLRSKGVIPVAILGTSSFDVNDVDPTTVTFGPNAADPFHNKPHFDKDVNVDGHADVVFHFRPPQTGIQSGDTQACISWTTMAGNMFTCCDAIRTVGP